MKYFHIVLFLTLCSCASVPKNQRQPAGSGDFFSQQIKNMNLETDFTSLFAENASEEGNEKVMPGIFRFQIGEQQWIYPVEVSVRGNSSKHDCSFKKLSLKIGKKADGPLAGISKLRLNTHCSDQPGYTEMGRITGPAGPIREGAVYDWMRVMGFSTYLSKTASITYKDSSSQRLTESFVLFLESKKDLGRRLGGKALEEEDLEDQVVFLDRLTETSRNEQTLKALLFNALIGNIDYSLQLTDLEGERHYNPISPPSGMWNMVAVDYDSAISIVPTDFDVSGIVVQRPEFSDEITKAISGCPTIRCEFPFSQIQKWRSFFTASIFASVARDYQNKEADLKSALEQNRNLGTNEKIYFQQNLEAFLEVLNRRVSVPVITASTNTFKDPDLKTVCGKENPEEGYDIKAPAGLPVKVLRTNAKSKQVLLLDTRDRVLNHPDGVGSGSCGGNVFLPTNVPISTAWPR